VENNVKTLNGKSWLARLRKQVLPMSG